jgi:hypothetical protein
LTVSRHTVHVSRPKFVPGPGCTYRPIYDLAKQLAATLTEDDGYLMRPPRIPAESVEDALDAGLVLIDEELLDTRPHGDSLVALPASDLHRTCVEAVLGRYWAITEATRAQATLHEAELLYAVCIDTDDEPYLFQAAEQAQTEFDTVAWAALVRYEITPLPSLLFAFLTTDDPHLAVRVPA